MGNLSAVGPDSPQQGLWGPPTLGGGHLGSHLEALRGMLHAEGHSICCLSGGAKRQGFGWVPSISVSPDPFSGSKMQKRNYNGALKCLELGSCEELGKKGACLCRWYWTAFIHQ